jgi:hypothetical protein
MTRGQIENRNFLSPTGFKFTLTRTPKVAFFCNQANIPDLNLGVAIQPSYTKMLPQPGDIIEFGDLSIRFLIDENLENYMEIQNWMRGLGFPERLEQFAQLEAQKSGRRQYVKEGQNIYSDGTLQVLTSSQIPNFQIIFKDLFPYSLTTMTFDATETDINYFTADVSFKYSIYDIVDLSGEPLYGY